jgi:hypothetical protein
MCVIVLKLIRFVNVGRELNEILVAVGKQLPWGEDITIDNLQIHLSAVLKYLEFIHTKTENDRQRQKNELSSQVVVFIHCNLKFEFQFHIHIFYAFN